MISPEGTTWKTTVEESQLSPAYGRYEPAPLVRSRERIKLPAETATVFLVEASAASARDNVREHVRMASTPHADAQLYELHIGEVNHEFFFARASQSGDNQPWSFGPWTSDAELLYCRTINEKLVQLIVIGAATLCWQGRSLLASAGPSEFIEWRKLDGTLDGTTTGKPSSFSAGVLDELAGDFSASSSNPSSTSSYAEKD